MDAINDAPKQVYLCGVDDLGNRFGTCFGRQPFCFILVVSLIIIPLFYPVSLCTMPWYTVLGHRTVYGPFRTKQEAIEAAFYQATSDVRQFSVVRHDTRNITEVYAAEHRCGRLRLSSSRME